MNSPILQYLGVDPAYIIIGLAAVSLIVIILLIVVLCKLKKLRRTYENFMRGKDAESLEENVLKFFERIELLEDSEKNIKQDVRGIKENLKVTYQKCGLVKYDAFREMSGALSFSLALLDKSNNGFIVSSMYSREGCYSYAKDIRDGKCEINLSEEEQEALKQAIEK